LREAEVVAELVAGFVKCEGIEVEFGGVLRKVEVVMIAVKLVCCGGHRKANH